MTVPNKLVREVVDALRNAGFQPEVQARRKHYQIFVEGHLVATRHHGSRNTAKRSGFCEQADTVVARARRLTSGGRGA